MKALQNLRFPSSGEKAVFGLLPRNWLLSSFLTLFAFMLAGCASQKVDWDYDTTQQVSGWKTYAWIDKSDSEPASIYHLDGLMDKRVRSAVDMELQAKGMRKVTASEADFLVNYMTVLKTKREENHVNSSIGYGVGSWGLGVRTETRVRDYEEGSLIIDFVNPADKELVWRGRSRSRVMQSSTPVKRTEKINTAVHAIMEGFPPGHKN